MLFNSLDTSDHGWNVWQANKYTALLSFMGFRHSNLVFSFYALHSTLLIYHGTVYESSSLYGRLEGSDKS